MPVPAYNASIKCKITDFWNKSQVLSTWRMISEGPLTPKQVTFSSLLSDKTGCETNELNLSEVNWRNGLGMTDVIENKQQTDQQHPFGMQKLIYIYIYWSLTSRKTPEKEKLFLHFISWYTHTITHILPNLIQIPCFWNGTANTDDNNKGHFWQQIDVNLWIGFLFYQPALLLHWLHFNTFFKIFIYIKKKDI